VPKSAPSPKKSKQATATGLPEKVSDVEAWLAAQPVRDDALCARLARQPSQRAPQRAAAIRALAAIGSDAALDAITSHRPAVGADGWSVAESQNGDTFDRAVAQEVLRAWARFDRRVFADRMFSRLRRLRMSDGAWAEDLRGIDAASDLDDLALLLRPRCALDPLASCGARRLSIVVPDRTGSLAPLTRMPALTSLSISCGEALTQSDVDDLGALPHVAILDLGLGRDVEVDVLLRVESLRRVRLGLGRREHAKRAVATVAELVQRGVDVFLYAHEPWVGDVTSDALGGATVVSHRGGVAVTSDATRATDLRAQLAANAFELG
jgi:hypothetical protein